MKEKLYTIPVNDAFNEKCECPVCKMYQTLQSDAIDFTMGPSYMEDDIRAVTDSTGFCSEHISLMLKKQNSLGMALMLSTHIHKTNADIAALIEKPKEKQGSFFRKKEKSGVAEYVEKLNRSCFVCDRINLSFDRYIATIYHLYEHDESFAGKIEASSGFCTEHFSRLYDDAPKYLNVKQTDEFRKLISKSYMDNMKRIEEEVLWYIDKFDYRFKDEPWKNSKDAIPRAILKTNSIMPEDDKNN